MIYSHATVSSGYQAEDKKGEGWGNQFQWGSPWASADKALCDVWLRG